LDRYAQVVCTLCGSAGYPKTVTPGSIAIEIMLWGFFLVPGLIYSVWRLSARHLACATCGKTSIVAVRSPAGRKLFEE